MEASDPALMLARFQFAFTISFHIVLAALSIGLANYLMVLEALWLWRKRQVYMDLYKFWLKVFALTVAVGTASGLVMEFEFGTNWSALASRAGGVLGPLMFYEVMVAFFLEAGFIGCPPIHGCTRPPGSAWRLMGDSCRWTGCRSSSIPRFPIEWST
jgi:cytochrome d ubiquinol oxidase subunit I